MTGEPAQPVSSPAPVSDRTILLIVAAYAAAFVAFGLAVDGPARSRAAWRRSSFRATRCSPTTSASAASALPAVNAGLLTLCACLVYLRHRRER